MRCHYFPVIAFKISGVKQVILVKPCVLKKLLSGSNESFRRIFSLSNVFKVKFSKSLVFLS